MTAHTEESLRAQLEQIERLITECGDNPNLLKLREHLKGRRDVTVQELERIRGKENATRKTP